MRKYLLLVLTTFSLGAMEKEETLPKEYTEQQCLLELRQMEIALKILEFKGSDLEKRCPKCVQKVFGGSGGYNHWGNTCKSCSQEFNDWDVKKALQEAACKAIVRNRRALNYQKQSDKK